MTSANPPPPPGCNSEAIPGEATPMCPPSPYPNQINIGSENQTPYVSYVPQQTGMPQSLPAGKSDTPTNRPAVQWMSRPVVENCPPGLEYLTQVDQILVHQVVELLEAFTGWETKNRYVLRNSVGQQVYYAMEDSDMCMRQLCGSSRGFAIFITDNLGKEVIIVRRELKIGAGCCWCASLNCCSHELSIEAPPGTKIGYVRQECSLINPRFSIRNENYETVLLIDGPFCVCQGAWCCDQEFKVKSKDGDHEIGKISKQFSGLIKEYFTDADNFGVQFPMDLDVKMKAVMVGAVFLIDFMFFESESNNRN